MRADFRPERTGFRPERTNFRPERADSRPERADFRPEKADFRPERADFRPERVWGRRTNERTDEQKSPVFYRTLSPSGLLPKRQKAAVPKEDQLTNRWTDGHSRV